jgi:hypothetical protein
MTVETKFIRLVKGSSGRFKMVMQVRAYGRNTSTGDQLGGDDAKCRPTVLLNDLFTEHSVVLLAIFRSDAVLRYERCGCRTTDAALRPR